MDDFFGNDGPFFEFINKAGQVIIANFLWMICCIPVITIIPASSAMYYGSIKTIRRDRGYIHKEFFRSFKHCLAKGIILSIVYGLLIAVLIFNLRIVDENNITYITVYIVMLALIAVSLIYIIPILSRFNMKLLDMIKLSLVMSIRHFVTTILMLAGFAIMVFLQIRILPMATVIFLPGTWCYISTFLIEKVLKKYMNQDVPSDEDAWYLE